MSDWFKPFGVLVAILLMVFAPVGWWNWYSSGVQQEVYRRQGVNMTQWEIFVGSKPIERSINIKQ